MNKIVVVLFLPLLLFAAGCPRPPEDRPLWSDRLRQSMGLIEGAADQDIQVKELDIVDTTVPTLEDSGLPEEGFEQNLSDRLMGSLNGFAALADDELILDEQSVIDPNAPQLESEGFS